MNRSMPVKTRRAVLERDGYACVDCGRTAAEIGGLRPLHVHHIVEFVNGGTHEPTNLATVCPKCHYRRDEAHRTQMRRATLRTIDVETETSGYIGIMDACARFGFSRHSLKLFMAKRGIKFYYNILHRRKLLIRRRELEKALKASSIRKAA